MEFKEFMVKHSKNYTQEETLDRYEAFKDNLDYIEAHNAKNLSYTLGVNRFADMKPHEWATFIQRGAGGGLVLLNREKKYGKRATPNCASSDLVAAGKVTTPKNQESCGSCWSFSTTGAIEGILPTLVPLSEQQLMDCDSNDAACDGGFMDNAFQYVEQVGLCSEEDYPYEEKKGSCRANYCTKVTGSKISGFTDIEEGDASSMAARLCTAPVSVGVDASGSDFQLYNGGVMTGSCGTDLDHGVLVVGFGNDGGYDYWKIKNSWGTYWGESGYIRIERDGSSSGKCGVLLAASYPLP